MLRAGEDKTILGAGICVHVSSVRVSKTLTPEASAEAMGWTERIERGCRVDDGDIAHVPLSLLVPSLPCVVLMRLGNIVLTRCGDSLARVADQYARSRYWTCVLLEDRT